MSSWCKNHSCARGYNPTLQQGGLAPQGGGGGGLHPHTEVGEAKRDQKPSFGTTMGSYEPSLGRGGVSYFVTCPVPPLPIAPSAFSIRFGGFWGSLKAKSGWRPFYRYSSVHNTSPWSLIYFWGFEPALVSYWEPGRGSEALSVRFPLAPNLDALRCLRCAKLSPVWPQSQNQSQVLDLVEASPSPGLRVPWHLSITTRLPELPPLPPGFILPPDVFALFSQGPVQDENSAKWPRLM